MSDIAPDESGGVLIELIMESCRVTGEIHLLGAPRRLVDIMNSIEGNFVLVHEGQLDDPYREHSEVRPFDVAQVPLDAILVAMPRGGAPQQGNPFETVAKVPVPGTLLLPGLEVSGNFHLLPDGRRSQNAIIATRGFAPVTEATVVATRGICNVWREPIVVVNLLRGFLYMPRMDPGHMPRMAPQGGPETPI